MKPNTAYLDIEYFNELVALANCAMEFEQEAKELRTKLEEVQAELETKQQEVSDKQETIDYWYDRAKKVEADLTALQAEQSKDEALTKWISVKERLPKGADGKGMEESVFAYLNNVESEAQVCPGWFDGNKWYLLEDKEDYPTKWGLDAVTHWMPLPEPPEVEK